jgi:hypothetical protein
MSSRFENWSKGDNPAVRGGDAAPGDRLLCRFTADLIFIRLFGWLLAGIEDRRAPAAGATA